MNSVLVISARDNVATALEPLDPGRKIRAGSATIEIREAIPRGHKIALQAIAAGDTVIKYGSAIGTASCDIAAGAHVHTHNVASTRGRGDLRLRAHDGNDAASNGPADLAAGARSSEPDAPRIAEPPDPAGIEPEACPPDDVSPLSTRRTGGYPQDRTSASSVVIPGTSTERES